MGMRRASNDTSWITDDKENMVGIGLGFDFCSEHEWGIAELQRALGVPKKDLPEGLRDRKMTALNGKFLFECYQAKFDSRLKNQRVKAYPAAILVFRSESYLPNSDRDILDWAKRETQFYSDPDDSKRQEDKDHTVCAWDSKSFVVHVRGDENIKRLVEIEQAFRRNDIVVAPPRGTSFIDRAGLCFVIDSRIPESYRKIVLDQDRDYARLIEAANATGVEKAIYRAGLGWYALTPKWADDGKTTVKFYLNPHEQDRYKSGWFSVEDLMAWVRGEGPVCKAETVQ